METFCPWDPAQYLFFSENIPPLLYYSHFATVGVALIIIFFILTKAKRTLATDLLTSLLLLFTAWSVIDVVVWATNRFDVVMFWWAIIVFIEPLIYSVAFYLLYTFIFKTIPPLKLNLFFFFLLLPLILLLPTHLNLEALNTYDCTVAEGPLALYYTYFIEIVSIIGIILLAIVDYRKNKGTENRQINKYFSLGLIAFLVSFTSGNIVGSLTYDWNLAQYGLFGLPVFAVFLTYIIVEFRVFNAKLIGAQALMIGLVSIIGSQLFFVDSHMNALLISLTLFLSSVGGVLLIRSVKKEIRQREELQNLTAKLEKANARLQVLDKQKSEFVSIASHQLRSPLTAIRGYASLLLDGDFGNIPKKAHEPLSRIQESSRLMALAIEDYLNVSRIEAGNMKYNYSDFNLRDETEHLCDDLRTDAMKKGLGLIFRSDLKSRGIIHADLGKTVQIVQNVIHNAIKYTEQGSIKVLVRDDVVRKKIFVDVIDTGIGMDPDTMETIFEKFERAKNANSVNIHGTGLGLFVALKMAEAMGGSITATSEGEGKGSCFTIAFPLAL